MHFIEVNVYYGIGLNTKRCRNVVSHDTQTGGKMTQASATKHDLEAALIEKCWKDPEFRNEVVTDPKGVLERHLGKPLPPELKIYVHEEDAKTLHFSIPPAPSAMTELSDEDLQKVAGGTEVAVVVSVALSVATLATSIGRSVTDGGSW